MISTKDKIAFGIGDMGNALAMQIIGSYLVFFMTVILGIPGTLSGLIIGLSIVWDAVTDPIMGYISDNTRLKWFGRRHLYIMIGSLGASLSILGIFSLPINSGLNVKTFALFLLIILYKTFITVLATPYAALGAELTSDYTDRTRLQSVRSLFFMSGVALSMVVGMFIFFQPTAVYPLGQLNPAAYRNIAIFTALGTFILPMITFFGTRKFIPHLNHSSNIKIKHGLNDFIQSFLSTFKNHSYRALVLTYTFINVAIAFINSLGLHVFTYTFGYSGTQIAIILGLQLIFSMVSQPYWISRVKRHDKRTAITEALRLMMIANLYFLILVMNSMSLQGQILYFIPYALIGGFGAGALFTIPSSMIADTVDVEELNSGSRKEGVYFGNLTFLYKLSQSVTILLIGLLMDVIGFKSGLLVQSLLTRQYLGYILFAGVGVAMIISSLCIKRYSLTKVQLHSIQEKLRMNLVKAKIKYNEE